MKLSKRTFIVVLALVVLMAFAACTPVEQPTQQPTAAPTDLQPSEAPKKDAIKAGEEYRYYLWSTTDSSDPFKDAGARQNMLQKRKDDFEEKYDITITYTASQGTPWEAYPRAAAAAGEPICEILNIGGPYVLPGTYYYDGVKGACLVELNQFAEYADFTNAEYWDQQSQAACTFDGGLYAAVPQLIGMEAVGPNVVTIYNADLLATGGYTAEQLHEWSEKGEWTWDKFYEVCVACTKEGDGVYGTAIGDNNALATSLVVSNGADFFASKEVDGVMKDRYVGNDPKAIKAWDFLVKLAQDGVMNYDGITELTLMGTSKVAMLVSCISRVTTFYNRVDFDYGIINPPKGPDAADYRSDMNWFVPMGVMRGVANPAGCAQFLCEYFAPEFGINSQENNDLLETELTAIFKDEKSVAVAKNITKYSSMQKYMLYHSVSDGESLVLNYVYGQAFKFINSEITPDNYFDSVVDKINSMIDGAVGG